ncbi:MAG: hypothetical protein ACI4U2_07350 [Christensenellaceae bacterium]
MSNRENYSGAYYGENPKVNLKTGALLYSLPEISLGGGSYRIDLSHVYRSESIGEGIGRVEDESEDEVKKPYAGIGNGWKLNVQHYVEESGGGYYYIDGIGTVHRFVLFDGSNQRYYDERNADLVLQRMKGGRTVITDGTGNKMYFDYAGRMYKSVSCENDEIAKCYVYDADGYLKKVFDRRY